MGFIIGVWAGLIALFISAVKAFLTTKTTKNGGTVSPGAKIAAGILIIWVIIIFIIAMCR